MNFIVEKTFEACSELSQNPSIGRVAHGDLLLLHTNFTDVMAGSRMFLRRSTDGGLTWSEPEWEIASKLDQGGVEGTITCLGNLVIIAYLEGSDLKRHPTNPKMTHMIRSTDAGKTWSASRPLDASVHGLLPFSHVIRLRKSERLLMPAYAEQGWLDRGGGGSRVCVLASDDDGVTWRLHATIAADPTVKGLRITETSLLELADGRLLAISRGDAHKSGAFPYGFRSVSEDGGATWTPATPININLCEPRLMLTVDGRILLVARSWPGNIYFYYRPLEDHEREPGSKQTETVAAGVREEFLSSVREFGVTLFSTTDDGQTWTPQLTMQNPRGDAPSLSGDPLRQHRYQAAYPDIQALGDGKCLVVFRQPDPAMPNIRPGLTYSHVFQRFVAANIVKISP